jgi:hypothetical protein
MVQIFWDTNSTARYKILTSFSDLPLRSIPAGVFYTSPTNRIIISYISSSVLDIFDPIEGALSEIHLGSGDLRLVGIFHERSEIILYVPDTREIIAMKMFSPQEQRKIADVPAETRLVRATKREKMQAALIFRKKHI